MYTIPAHTLLISCVKFDPVAGDFILTSSFDKLAKVRDLFWCMSLQKFFAIPNSVNFFIRISTLKVLLDTFQ